MTKPKLPVLEAPNGFVFEIRISLEAGNEYKLYASSFTEDLESYTIPPNIQNIYPEAPVSLSINHALIAAVSARVVPGFRVRRDDEDFIPPHKVDGEEVPF